LGDTFNLPTKISDVEGYYIDFLGLKIILIVYSEYKNRIKNKPVKLMGCTLTEMTINLSEAGNRFTSFIFPLPPFISDAGIFMVPEIFVGLRPRL